MSKTQSTNTTFKLGHLSFVIVKAAAWLWKPGVKKMILMRNSSTTGNDESEKNCFSQWQLDKRRKQHLSNCRTRLYLLQHSNQIRYWTSEIWQWNYPTRHHLNCWRTSWRSYLMLNGACGYTDLHRGIDGLAGIVQNEFELDPFQNILCLFAVVEPIALKVFSGKVTVFYCSTSV